MNKTTLRRPFVIASLTLLGANWASPVLADPCEAPLPRQGERFSGVVRYIGDGDGLCVGPADRPDRWIEIRLADFYAPELHERGGAEAKQRLAQLTLGKTIACRAGRRSYDRVIAACTLGRRPLGQLLRDRGGVEGGRGWRRRP
jgi:endonuclease YncB( thermonuclease family)